MSIYVNLVEASIRCAPLAFYRLIAIPDMWPRFHPVTAAVRAMDGTTSEPATVGTSFIETIKRPDQPIEAHWEVLVAEPGRAFTFRSRRFADLPVVMTIAWKLEPVGELTKIERFMRTDVNAGHALPREAAIHFCLPDVHEKFVAILAEHLTADPSPPH